jgi:hypothetical protein
MFQDVGTTTTSDYTISIFAKHNSRILQIFAGGGDISGNPYANFDLENGVFNNNGCNDAFIQDYGNGWYRCGIVVTCLFMGRTIRSRFLSNIIHTNIRNYCNSFSRNL